MVNLGRHLQNYFCRLLFISDNHAHNAPGRGVSMNDRVKIKALNQGLASHWLFATYLQYPGAMLWQPNLQMELGNE